MDAPTSSATAPAPTALDDDVLLKHAQEVFTSAVNWRDEEVRERWLKSNDLYNCKFPARTAKTSDVLTGQSRLFIPKTYSHVQRILVDVLDALFGDGAEIVNVTNWKTLPAEVRAIVKALLNYRISGHSIDLYQELYEAALDALRNKVGIWKVYPMNVIDTTTGAAQFEPVIECLPYEDVFFHPRATWKDYWKRPVVHRFRLPLDEARRRGYRNLEDAQTDLPETDEIKQQRAQDQGSPFRDPVFTIEGQRDLICYEIWTRLDLDGDGLLESCSYVLCGDPGSPRRVIRDVQLNTLPYGQGRGPIVVGQTLPESHQMYGKDLPEITEGLQKETNALRNQDREAVALSLRNHLLVSRHAGIDLPSLLNRRIGGVTMGDEISENSIREVKSSPPPPQSIQQQARTDQDYYETTSVPPNLMGAPSSPDETATAVTRHEFNANKKIAHMIRNLAQTLVLPSMRMLLQLEQEYESDEFIALVTGRVLGMQFANDSIPPRNVIQGEFELTVELGVNKQQQLNRLLLLSDRANVANQTTMALVQAGVVHPMEAKFVSQQAIWERLLPLVGERNPEDFQIDALPPMMPMLPPKGVASQTGAPANQGSPVAPTEAGAGNPHGF